MGDSHLHGPPPTIVVAPCDDERGWCVESRGHVLARAESRAAAELRAVGRLIEIGGGQLVIRYQSAHR